MIEIEPMNSIFEDWALRAVLLFCDQETKDKLLYEESEVIQLDVRSIRTTTLHAGRRAYLVNGCRADSGRHQVSGDAGKT